MEWKNVRKVEIWLDGLKNNGWQETDQEKEGQWIITCFKKAWKAERKSKRYNAAKCPI